MFIAIVEFHDARDLPKAFGPFDSRKQAQDWLDDWPLPVTARLRNEHVPFTDPNQFARVTITTLEGWKLEAE